MYLIATVVILVLFFLTLWIGTVIPERWYRRALGL